MKKAFIIIIVLTSATSVFAQPMDQLFPSKKGEDSAQDVKERTGLTREEIEKVVKDKGADFTACLEAFYKLKGITVSLTINGTLHVRSSGEVEYVKSLNATGVAVNKNFLACIEDRVKAWRFPPFKAEFMDVSFTKSVTMNWKAEEPKKEEGKKEDKGTEGGKEGGKK